MKRIILTHICCVCFVVSMVAQQQDSIAKIRDAAAALDSAMQRRGRMDSLYRVDFNALDYAMQKRYVPQGRPFTNKRFIDNLFLGFYGGYNCVVPQTDIKFSGGPGVGVSIMKSFSHKHALRVGGGWTTANRKSDNEKWESFSVGIDHIYNLSSAFGGYDPYRVLELSTVEGIGAHYATLSGKKKKAVDFHLGLQMKLATGTRMDLFFEPGFALYSDGIDFSENNPHGYDWGYYTRLGMNYRMGTYIPKGSTEAASESFLDNTFISAGMGLQTQLSTLVRDRGMLSSSGPVFNVAAGKWFLDFFGIRLSAFGSYNAWKVNEKAGMDRMTMYAGGRAEAMLNPFALFKKDVRSMKWGIVPVFGVELGLMKKQDESEVLSKSYTAVTGGVQFKYFPTENFSFFVEPHLSFVPYTFIEKTVSGKVNEYAYMDKLMNVSVGIELCRPSRARWQSLAKLKGDFQPYYFTTYSIGMTVPQQINRSIGRRPGFIIGTSFGRQFTPISGVRLGLDFTSDVTRTSTDVADRYVCSNLFADYLFDISNLVLGYDSQRKFGAEVLGGIVMSRRFDPKESFLGVEGGVRPYWKIDQQFDIFAEPKLRVYTKRYLHAKNGMPGTPVQLAFSIGTAYRFNTSLSRKRQETEFGDGTLWANSFISGGIGVQTLLGSGRSVGLLSSLGPSMSLSVGKWLLPLWGLRFSGFAGLSSWTQTRDSRGALLDKRVMQGGVRLESMFDILSLVHYDKDRRWGIIPMAGLELGKVKKQSSQADVEAAGAKYAAVTAGLQCQYRVTDFISVFVEPRLTRIPYSYHNVHAKTNVTGARLSQVDNVMSVQMGLQFNCGQMAHRRKGVLADRTDFEPYYFTSWSLGGILPVHRVKYNSGSKMGVAVELSAGRQFLPSSGAQVGIDYSVLPGKGNVQAVKLIHLSADYLFDVTHFMGGYDEDRKLAAKILAGPMLAFGSEPNKFTIGMEGGLQLVYKLAKGFSVFAQPRLRLYSKSIAAGQDSSPIHGTFHIGTSYRF